MKKALFRHYAERELFIFIRLKVLGYAEIESFIGIEITRQSSTEALPEKLPNQNLLQKLTVSLALFFAASAKNSI